MTKSHPILILEKIYKFFFILLLPLIRQLASPQFSLSSNIILEIILATAIIVYAVAYRNNCKYQITEKFITVTMGVIFKQKIIMPCNKISSIDIEEKLSLKIGRAVKIHIDTESGGPRKADLSLTVNREEAERIIELLYGKSYSPQYKSSFFRVAIASASGSKALTGILIIYPLINNISKLADRRVEEEIYGVINAAQKATAKILPPAISAIAYIILIGFIVSFLYLLFAQANFEFSKKDDWIVTRRGLFLTRITLIRIDSINSVMVRQTPLMKIFKLYQTQIYSAGYGKEKGELALLIPADSLKNIKLNALYIFDTEEGKAKLKVPREGRKAYYLPQLVALIALILIIIFSSIFWSAGQYVLLVGSALLLMQSAYLFVSFKAIKKTELDCNFHQFCKQKRLSFLWIYIQPDKIREVNISQNSLQRKKGVCSVTIVPNSERRITHKIKNLDYESALFYKELSIK